eukprot:m.39508 g.39508  ORF g.39508 m.39508 type:complete len:153 (+) comp32746_c0_seq11:1028-1486(+)
MNFFVWLSGGKSSNVFCVLFSLVIHLLLRFCLICTQKILQYVELAKDALRFCILTSTDRSSPWRVEKAEGGFVCEGLSRRKQPKLFRCSGIINCSPDDVFRILHIEGDKQPLWNPTVLKSQAGLVIVSHVAHIYLTNSLFLSHCTKLVKIQT